MEGVCPGGLPHPLLKCLLGYTPLSKCMLGYTMDRRNDTHLLKLLRVVIIRIF